MSVYQVIAKKFRPKNFSEVFAQEAIVQTLKNAIRMGRTGHAYLFCGTRGTGKTTLARLFAKAINCKNLGSDQEPCNSCPSCTEITAGHSLDVIEIDGASNRGIDDIRSLNETVSYAASSGKYKIYIIDEVHMLTKEAFNALLKTLEEPPAHVIFFFATTEPHKVLPTILSRCQRFDLRRINPEKIEEKLTAIAQKLEIAIEPAALKLIAHHAEGSLRDAESLLDQLLCYEEPPITREHATKALGLVQNDLFFALDRAVGQYDLAAPFALTNTLFEAGCHLEHFLESLAEHYRTIATVQMGEKPPFPEYATSAKLYSKYHVLETLDYLIGALEKGKQTPFKKIHIEVALLHIIRTSKRIPLESLVERLEKLQKGEAPEPAAPPPKIQPKVAKAPEPPPTPKPAAPVEEVPFFPEKPAPPQSPPAPSAAQPAPPPATIQEKIKQEQVMRFTSVALNGSLKK